ncbi:hypothetical protein EJ08DRAFT_651992 [Tothia fuscella]|uniref:Uncharacterized protein n=1 Tax=Tothia fuscella TaxID=1048955 RepID=A0A9P4NKE4_9PEZI|nr:hypothetical protein EJ08DRAFT_651992 [Tothia fuscella]
MKGLMISSTTCPNFYISSGHIELFELEKVARKLLSYLQKASRPTSLSLRITIHQNLFRPPAGIPPPPPPYPPGAQPGPPTPPQTWLLEGKKYQNPTDDYEANVLFLVKHIATPFKELRGVSKVHLKDIWTMQRPTPPPHSPPRYPPYRPQNPAMRHCSISGDYHPNNMFIYHIPRPLGHEVVLDSSNDAFASFKTDFENRLRVAGRFLRNQ